MQNDLTYNRPVPKRLQPFAWGIFAAAIVVVTYSSVVPSDPGFTISHFDKLQHAGAYAVLTGLFALAMPRLGLLGVFIVPALYGAGLEVAQAVMPFGRTGSILDLAANTLGAICAILVWCLWVQYRAVRLKRS